MPDYSYYQKEVSEIFAELKTEKCGLSSDEAEKRLREHGSNSFKEEKQTPLFVLFFLQFKDPLIYILLLAAIITFAIRHYIDMSVIMAALIINAVVGFIQEFQAEQAMRKIQEMTELKAAVTRNCADEKIDASDLVPGDVIGLSAGNKVPADARIFEEIELHIDESALTGESVPQEKDTAAIKRSNVMVADQENMAFMGTVVVRGKAKAVVVATGLDTQIGRISEKIKTTKKEKTPLQKRLSEFSGIVGIISVGLALFIFAVGVLKSKPVIDMVLVSISLAVSIIPEGLPVAITIAMAIGMKRMADRNAIIRKLVAVETLGSCDYICSDKTGTITENKMFVKEAFANEKTYKFKGEGYAPEGEITLEDSPVKDDKDLRALLLCGALCNDAKLVHKGSVWQIEGDPTEAALLVSAGKFNIRREKEEGEYEYIEEVPFSSKRQFMAVLYRHKDKDVIFVKGAPEKILEFCGQKGNNPLQDNYAQMTAQGFRVLGFALKEKAGIEKSDLEKEATGGLTFLGYQGIIDPPRPSAIEAIKQTRDAGIRTVMVTGDHKQTAEIIAKTIGLLDEQSMIVEGSELEEKGEAFLKENCEKIRVYARVGPDHKLKIVQALQDKGHIVAVTGDGVNDAPALKKSNIGVSMGGIGTDVAREASDMTLKDDNFATIFEATKVAKVIFDNIRKVIFFLLGPSIGEASIIILCLFLGLPLPFLATQILWVNLVTNGLQDIALVYEPGEPDIARRRPRNPKEPVVNAFILRRLILVG
ncbi:MAG: HAD-IC family P-type ATPase, partial [Candidatus Margulisiibacteriota bacterium]